MAAQDQNNSLDHHGSELSEMQLRVRALETVLTEKGYVDPAALDLIIEAYETRIGPHLGARVVARAWVDPDFKKELLTDANKAIAKLGLEQKIGDHLVVAENTLSTHNMIVCTLCSCYPWDLLGCRQSGTSPRPTDREPSRSRAPSSPTSVSHCPPTRRFVSGTRLPRHGSWSCRYGLRAPKAGARRSSPSS